MTDEVSKLPPFGTAESVLGAKISELEAKVANTADADLKSILNVILKAGEKTLAEMDVLKSRIEAADKAANDAAEAAAKRVKRADLVAAASIAGAIDAKEALQFVKLGEVSVNDAGETNAGDLVAALKKSKPHLFSRISTSAAAASPPIADTVRKNVLAMTKDEYASAKAAIIKQ